MPSRERRALSQTEAYPPPLAPVLNAKLQLRLSGCKKQTTELWQEVSPPQLSLLPVVQKPGSPSLWS